MERLSYLKSKVKELHIPLPNFEFFHKPSSEEEAFDNFVGHEDISQQLEEWIKSGDSGSYLVTGYRGMGKTSFVGQVLNKMTCARRMHPTFIVITLASSAFIFSAVVCLFLCAFGKIQCQDITPFKDITQWFEYFFATGKMQNFQDITKLQWFGYFFDTFIISFIVLAFILLRDICLKKLQKIKRWHYGIDESDYKNHKTWFGKVFNIRDIACSKYNIVVKLNLGHETLHERDILSLIAKRVYNEYKKHVSNFYTNWIGIISKTLVLSLMSILTVRYLDRIDVISRVFLNLSMDTSWCTDKTIIYETTGTIYLYIRNIVNIIIENKLVFAIVAVIIFYFGAKWLYNFAVSHTPFLRKHSQTHILHELKSLIDRIDSVVTEDSGTNTGYTNATSILSLNLSRKKHKTYPYASSREIEDNLIDIFRQMQVSRPIVGKILDLINCKCENKLFRFPKFIIVFDELDKIDPVYNQQVKIEKEVPEYEHSGAFQGGSVIRNRKQNVFRLLGNMKLFMGSAKAKFIFIAGRELYDAFLADLSDREFAASSIFNNVIYVDSFLESSTKQKNIVTKTEEYICNYLIPRNFYIKNAQEQYYIETARKPKPLGNFRLIWQRFTWLQRLFYYKKWYKELKNLKENIKHKEHIQSTIKNLRIPNLRLYKKYLIKVLVESQIKAKLKKAGIDESKVSSFIELNNWLENHPSLQQNFSKELACLKHTYTFIDGAIAFLKHFKCLFYCKKWDTNLKKLKDCIKKYLIKVLVVRKIKSKLKEDAERTIRKISSSIELNNWLKNNPSLQQNFSEELADLEHTFLFIDKVIVFLNQFVIYLTHICNGSPKKITLYFEKYVTGFIASHPKNPFSNADSKTIKNTKYCLSFTANDQQSIGFIYYLTYPIMQTIINNASHFGDKMLVSTSFLIDHILKHHKGGFAQENIEHTPELLEVYHIANLRTIIGIILGFLRQNYVTDICSGVYNYKFRKSIADEIMYNSRISEEISAIFNFTLDESLPVKRYYFKQIEETQKLYFEVEKESGRYKIGKDHYIQNQYAILLISQLETLAEVHLADEEYNEAIQYFQMAFEICKSELKKIKVSKDKLHIFVLFNRIALKFGLAKECKGYNNEAYAIYSTLLDYLVEFRNLQETELGLNYFYEDNDLSKQGALGEWKAKKVKVFHKCNGAIKPQDVFHEAKVLPFFRDSEEIKDAEIDYLMDSDYLISGLSKVLSPAKQEMLSRLSLFSETRSIFQGILANLFVIEKINVNGITQENLDVAEDQFKYIYMLTDSKDKFLQAADFYKKMASIMFLKNYSNSKPDEYLQMWGFDIYETINEFLFINSHLYNSRIDGKFPKEILKEFFIDGINEYNLMNDFYCVTKLNVIKIKKLIETHYDKKLKLIKSDIISLLFKFIRFGVKKREKYFGDGNNNRIYLDTNKLTACKKCYEKCKNRELNHPCYACCYIAKVIDIYIHRFIEQGDYTKINNEDNVIRSTLYNSRDLKIFLLLKKFKTQPLNERYYFVFASALRIQADVLLSCTNNDNDESYINPNFITSFLNSIRWFYEYNYTYFEDFIIQMYKYNKITNLEKVILYHWLSAEYFYLNNSPIDANECLVKILIIFDKYINNCKEEEKLFKVKNKKADKLFASSLKAIGNTIVRRVLRNANTANDDVNFIEIHNLKFILRARHTSNINLSTLSTTADIEDILFAYCKLEADSIYITNEETNPVYWDCYQSMLLSPYRFSFTIDEKIISMEFKAKMNMKILQYICKKAKNEKVELDFYDPFFTAGYFEFLKCYFVDNEYNLCDDLKKLNIFQNETVNSIKNKIDALNFLIEDSLYCLTQITEILTSAKFANYSNSFIGDIFYEITKWSTIYSLTYAVYPKYSAPDNKTDNKTDNTTDMFIKKETTTMVTRAEAFKCVPTIPHNFKDNVEKVIKKIKDDASDNKSITNRDFETSILNAIGTGNRHILVPNYSVGMAMKYYHRATEMHSNGKVYKEMIDSMHIIDDDISNGMHNFSLALERYTMNCGIITKKLEYLRKYYKYSLSYPLTNYL